MQFRERYRYNPSIDKLGSGGFATVYKAFDTLLEREVALKIFHTSESDRVSLLSELKRMSRLDHPNLIRCLDILSVEVTNVHGLTEQLNIGVMEYANSGSLKEFFDGNKNLEQVKDLLIQVLRGLSYMHVKGMIHRDLKPQNILLSSQDGVLVPKITDFGISKSLSNQTQASSVVMGTIEYMAPEQFNPQRYGIDGRIGTNLDLWSFGILVYEAITGRHLFGEGERNSSSEQVMQAILSFQLPEDIESVAEPFRSVIKRCLVADAKLRARDAGELITLLQKEEKDFVKPTQQSYGGETRVIAKEEKEEAKKPAPKPEVRQPHRVVPSSEPPPRSSSLPPEPSPITYEDRLIGRESAKTNQLKKYLTLAAVIIVIVIGLGYAVTKTKDKHNLASGIATEQKPQIKGEAEWLKEIEEAKKGAPGDKSKLLKLYTACAGEGYAECQYQAAMLLLERKRYADVMALATKAGDQKHTKALSLLAYLYYTGAGVDKSIQKARELYQQAADGGNSVACLMLGRMYLTGETVAKDPATAKDYFQKAVDAGDDKEGVQQARTELAKLSK